jgi:hypothetical protein
MVAVADLLPELAVIVATPAETPVATPVLDMETTVASEECHCTDEVRSRVLPSL